MLIKPQFIIICREAFLTAGTNNLNLINIFTQVNADRFPYTMPPFSLVVNFDADLAGSHVLRSDLFGPDGKQVAHTELPIQTTGGNWQVIATFEHLQIAAAGTHTFQLLLDDQPLGSRVMDVRATAGQVKPPAIV